MTKKMMGWGLLCLVFMVAILSGCGGGGEVADVTAGLLVYYPFNNSVVDTIETTTPDVHNTSFTTDRFGSPNKAVSFDGDAAHYITLGYFSISGTAFTVSMWIKSSSTTSYPIYCSILNFHQKDANTLTFNIPDATTEIAIDGTVTQNTWTHIVGVYDNTSRNGILYINGVQSGSGTKTNTLTSLDVNGFQFAGTWAGAIDDFRIYNRVLTPSEINRLYEYHNN